MVIGSVKLLCLASLCLLYCSTHSVAQTSSGDTIIVQSRGSGELNSLHLDNLVAALRNSPAERLFVVARLGDGETARRLNFIRLEGAGLYLVSSGRIPKERVVFAEGERAKGEGFSRNAEIGNHRIDELEK